ncbi:long-chain fatty acid transport protein 4-like isoform X2 [Folsomia candida]|uniref:long-chain fatty acid transport protein 4-like isoform X2 n=1 Tax=Folsomia candida TaxID=158441 RepID=UPI001604E583|nr:long-chain fatty acid transport protein 4-like isoform X2 [Folsomia candida]
MFLAPCFSFGMISKFIQLTVWTFLGVRRIMTVFKYFDETVAKRGTKACFLFEDEIWTFAKVQNETFRVAKYFRDAGYQKGDVVGLLMENRPEFICTWLGLSRIGVITSLINTQLRRSSLTHYLKVSNCRGLIFGEELTCAIQECLDSNDPAENIPAGVTALHSVSDRMATKDILTHGHVNLTREMGLFSEDGLCCEEFPDVVGSEDVVLHVFTSGTTGRAKAAKMKHSRLATFATPIFGLELNPDRDVLLTPIPLYHVQGGLLVVGLPLYHGVPQVIIRKFSASNFWKQCVKHDVTCCQYLGEILRYLLNQPPTREEKLHKVHTFYGNGANPVVWKRFVERFDTIKIKELYGSTEGNCGSSRIFGT